MYSSLKKASTGARSQWNTKRYHNRQGETKSNKFTFGTSWLPDLLCKHWLTSSVWSFCRCGADLPPGKTSQVARSKEKRWYSQVTDIWKPFPFGESSEISDEFHYLLKCSLPTFSHLMGIFLKSVHFRDIHLMNECPVRRHFHIFWLVQWKHWR